MSEQRDPIERALDVAVYAPLGLAMSLREILPKLAERGRQQMGGQVHLARMVGELAVKQGRKRAEKVISPLGRQAMQFVSEWGSRPRTPPPERSPEGRDGGGDGQRDHGRSDSYGVGSVTHDRGDGVRQPTGGSPVGALPIPGYDTLSASQVVQRLEGLSPDELEAVRAYEQAGRARKTVLTRISQLKSS